MPRRSFTILALVVGFFASSLVVASPAADAAPTQAWERRFTDLVIHSSPTIGDVNGDGVNDVVVGSHNGRVYAFDAQGRNLPGWPQRVGPGRTVTGIDSSPTIADLDKDGRNEVIVSYGTLRESNAPRDGGVIIFNRDGSRRCGFVSRDRLGGGNGWADPVFSTPAVGDVTGNGLPEVVFGSFDHYVYVLDRRCGKAGEFFTEDTIFSSPALADVDRDGRAEIFVGGDSSPGGNVDHLGGFLWSLEFGTRGLTERWRRGVGEIVISSPALGDIDGDGQLEAVFGTGDFYKNADSRRVFAVNVENGSDVPGWPQNTGGDGWSSPAVGDLDGNGRADVVIGARDGALYAWRGNGSRLWAKNPSAGTPYTAGIITGGPTIADINGDGRSEVLSATGNAVFALRGSNGALVSAFSINWQFQNSPAVGKFGNSWRVIAAGYIERDRVMRVASFRIPAARRAPWPQFHRSRTHTGAPATRPFGQHGYWILDVEGDVYSFGSARFLGGIPSLRARGHNIGQVPAMWMSRTPSGAGYYVLDRVGGMFTFGDARFHGSVPGLRAQGIPIGEASVIALSPTATGGGYWLLDEFGGMFSFGDAKFFGSVPELRNRGVRIGQAEVIAVASTPKARGYFLLDAQGGMFAFGDARFRGSVPGLRNQGIAVGPARIVGMAVTRSGGGYWLVDEFGGMFAFGDAKFHGSIPSLREQGVPVGSARIVAMVPTPSGGGYWLVDAFGGVYAFGDARYLGSLPGFGVATRAVALAPSG